MNLEKLHDAIHSNKPITVKDFSEVDEIRNLANLVGWKIPRMQVPIYEVKLPGLNSDNGPQYLARKRKSGSPYQVFAVGRSNSGMRMSDFLFKIDQIPQEYRKYAMFRKYEEIDITD